MSKLLKLKKWLTIPEAASYLSIVLAEPVSEADVLQLALDEHLTLSVQFINGVRARKMRAVPVERARTYQLLAVDRGSVGWTDKIFSGVPLEEDEYLERDPDERHMFLDGVWDLRMFSNDRLHVERSLNKLTDRPEVTGFDPNEGVYVFSEDDSSIFELLEPETSKSYAEIVSAQLPQNTTDHIVGKPENTRLKISTGPSRLIDLPKDSVLVVRIDAVREFERLVTVEDEVKVSRVSSLTEKERSSLKKQIAALALVLASRTRTFRLGDKPNHLQIADATHRLLENLPGADAFGVSKTSIRTSIAEGIVLLGPLGKLPTDKNSLPVDQNMRD